ncbi:MAG: RDD family protein [Devosia sp.]
MSTTRPDLPDPRTAPQLFDGVLMRRVFAFVVDTIILGFISMIILLVGTIAGFLTFGLAWLSLPIVIPVAILGYYAATLGSPMRATVGMSVMDIVLVPARGYPLDGWKILIHPLVFWITVWVAWPVSLVVALFTPRQQMVQDLVTGTLMLRRSPMARHWAGQRA